MTDKLRIKIAKQEAARPAEQAKRLKGAGEYADTGWRVLGIPFGGPIQGRDSDGEAFTPDTDIALSVGDKRPITYYHGYGPDSPDEMQPHPAILGEAVYTGKDDRGHWFDVLLDSGEPLSIRLIEAGPEAVKASSGAVSHLVRKDAGGLIACWPLGELALFDTNDWRQPANTYAVVEERAKLLTESEAKAGEAPVLVEGLVSAVKSKPLQKSMEEKMDEEKIVEEVKAEEPKVDIKAEFESMKKSLLEELKAAPGEVKGVPTVKNAKESPSFIKAMLAWAQGDNPRGFKGNDLELKGAWQGQIDDEGGYAVPDDFYNRIVEQREELSWVRKAPVSRFVTNRDRILIPTEATAGTKLVVTAEEDAYDENEPVFGQVALTIHKFTKMIKVSEEMLDGDAVGLEAYISSIVARASAAAENYYCTIGNGSSAPQGIITGATASGITNAAKATILASEVISTMGTVASPYHNANSGFLMTGASKFHIMASTGNNFQFIPTPSGGDILGYPIYIAPDMATIGTANGKAVLFGDFSMYAFAERQGVTLSRNPYLYQASGQVGLFVKQRFGGAVLQTLALKYLTLAST
jgi:HK97 family phage major capsid protein